LSEFEKEILIMYLHKKSYVEMANEMISKEPNITYYKKNKIIKSIDNA
jgi:hypothetical protein